MMTFIDVLRHNALDMPDRRDVAVDVVLKLLADLRQHYCMLGEAGLISAINRHTDDAFVHVPRRVEKPAPLVMHSAAGLIEAAISDATPQIIAAAVAASHRAKERGL